MLHAYHRQKITGGFQNAQIKAFYEEAKSKYPNFRDEYFLSNHREFFAVTASIYFFGDIPRPPSRRSVIRHWRAQNFGDIRVRLVEYTPGYLADHWCDKSHIVFCLEGELETELADGRKFTIKPGMSYQVGDNDAPLPSSSKIGAKLFIVD